MTDPNDDPRLDQLVDLVVELAAGDLTARLEPSPARDAVDAVITGVNLLADELHQMYMDLEARVAERTLLLRKAQRDLERLALTDSLTGLANRTLLGDRIGQAILRADRDALPPAVVVLDLDQFKVINDSLGHGAGDAVLVEVARRLLAVVREIDTVARLGGDEFAIVMPDATEEGALLVAHRVLGALQTPVSIGNSEVQASASIGLRFGMRGHSADDLLRDADIAMYEAKSRGKGNVQIFEPSMHHASQERMQILSELSHAVANHELALHYQPIVRLRDGVIVGAEALIRWDHPTRGMILPEIFITLAEESGLIADLGHWVLRTAISSLHAWLDRFPELIDFTVHVNISPAEIRRPGLADFIRDTLADLTVPANRLALELSETALMTGDIGALQALTELKDLGASVQIDDFGTGYSSIAYLRELPVDTVKVDQSLIASITKEPANGGFMRAVLQLVESVGLRAILFGIESATEVRELRRVGAIYGQGYYFSPPVTADELGQLLGVGARLGRRAPTPQS